MNSQTGKFQECQRLQVTRDMEGEQQVVRITVERFDACLGWYTAGALSLPVCQLPLLEQALAALSTPVCADCDGNACMRKIIPFPTLTATPAVVESAG